MFSLFRKKAKSAKNSYTVNTLPPSGKGDKTRTKDDREKRGSIASSSSSVSLEKHPLESSGPVCESHFGRGQSRTAFTTFLEEKDNYQKVKKSNSSKKEKSSTSKKEKKKEKERAKSMVVNSYLTKTTPPMTHKFLSGNETLLVTPTNKRKAPPPPTERVTSMPQDESFESGTSSLSTLATSDIQSAVNSSSDSSFSPEWNLSHGRLKISTQPVAGTKSGERSTKKERAAKRVITDTSSSEGVHTMSDSSHENEEIDQTATRISLQSPHRKEQSKLSVIAEDKVNERFTPQVKNQENGNKNDVRLSTPRPVPPPRKNRGHISSVMKRLNFDQELSKNRGMYKSSEDLSLNSKEKRGLRLLNRFGGSMQVINVEIDEDLKMDKTLSRSLDRFVVDNSSSIIEILEEESVLNSKVFSLPDITKDLPSISDTSSVVSGQDNMPSWRPNQSETSSMVGGHKLVPTSTPLPLPSIANQSLPGHEVGNDSVLVEEDYTPSSVSYGTPNISALTFLHQEGDSLVVGDIPQLELPDSDDSEDSGSVDDSWFKKQTQDMLNLHENTPPQKKKILVDRSLLLVESDDPDDEKNVAFSTENSMEQNILCMSDSQMSKNPSPESKENVVSENTVVPTEVSLKLEEDPITRSGDSLPQIEVSLTQDEVSMSHAEVSISQDSVCLDESEIVGRYEWETKPPSDWDGDDVIEWCQAKALDDVAETIFGSVTSGKALLELTAEKLDELELRDLQVRKRLLQELDALRATAASPSFWNKKESSPHRKSDHGMAQRHQGQIYPEQSYHNEKRNSHPKLSRRLSTSAESLSFNHNARGHHPRRSSTGNVAVADVYFQHSHKNYLKLPLAKWSNPDVLHWLGSTGLTKFINTFAANKITGHDLAEINMRLLDDIEIRTTEDRELLLSKLYELQHPQGPSLDDILSQSEDNSHTPSKRSRSPTSKRSRSPTSKRSRSRRKSETMPRNQDSVSPRRNSRIHVEGEKRQASFNKIRDYVSPKLFGQKRDNENIHIWHDLLGSVESYSVRVNESTTAVEIINKLLSDLEITDDPKLYHLVATARTKHRQDIIEELGQYACPLSVQRGWTGGGPCKLELRCCTGSNIRVICQVTGMKARGKIMKVAPTSTAVEILQVALHKFHLKNVDPSLFSLMEIRPDTGEFLDLADNDVILDLQSDAFVLCNHGNRDNVIKSQSNTLPYLDQTTGIIRRNSSLNSHGSSIHSQGSLQSGGSDTVRHQLDKLDALEEQMKDIEASLVGETLDAPDNRLSTRSPSPSSQYYPGYHSNNTGCSHHGNTSRYVTPRKQKIPSGEELLSTEPNQADYLELLREVALMRESLTERDSTIQQMGKQHDLMKTHAKRSVQLEKQIRELQLQVTQLKTEKYRNSSSSSSIPADDSEVLRLEQELSEVTARVRQQEERAIVATQRLDQTQLSRSVREELESEVSVAQGNLLALKQRQADLYAKLELTRNEHDRRELREKNSSLCVFDALVDEEVMQAIRVQINAPSGGGYGFLVGRDRSNRHIIKHVEQGTGVVKGDRILEVNGQKVFLMQEADLHLALRQAQPTLRLVVLREQPIRNRHTSEDMESVKEDLSLAMLEVESLTQENQDLIKEMSKLKRANNRLRDDNERLTGELTELHRKMTVSDGQLNNFTEVLQEVKKSDLHLDSTKDINPKRKTLMPSNMKELQTMPSFDDDTGISDNESLENDLNLEDDDSEDQTNEGGTAGVERPDT